MINDAEFKKLAYSLSWNTSEIVYLVILFL